MHVLLRGSTAKGVFSGIAVVATSHGLGAWPAAAFSGSGMRARAGLDPGCTETAQVTFVGGIRHFMGPLHRKHQVLAREEHMRQGEIPFDFPHHGQ